MILDDSTFERIRSITGYDHVEYVSRLHNGTARFVCYDGSRIAPYRASIIDVNESLRIVHLGIYAESALSDAIGIRPVSYP